MTDQVPKIWLGFGRAMEKWGLMQVEQEQGLFFCTHDVENSSKIFCFLLHT